MSPSTLTLLWPCRYYWISSISLRNKLAIIAKWTVNSVLGRDVSRF